MLVHVVRDDHLLTYATMLSIKQQPRTYNLSVFIFNLTLPALSKPRNTSFPLFLCKPIENQTI